MEGGDGNAGNKYYLIFTRSFPGTGTGTETETGTGTSRVLSLGGVGEFGPWTVGCGLGSCPKVNKDGCSGNKR